MKKIAVIGLGYVGLPLAVEFGKKEYPVVGFDINHSRVDELLNGFDRTLECDKAELSSARNLRFSSDPTDLKVASIFIVTVPTPVDKANRPDFSPLISASETVARALKDGDIVIYESTVYPGATEEICVPVLEKVSGLRFNRDFFCGYSPERINPGDRVNTLTKIKKITSGSTLATADEVDKLYQSIISAGTWRAPSIKVAEAAKVIENTQRDLNIAFVNEISMILDRIGIDTVEVLEAAGSKWNFLPFRPGLVGGHCIGVDPFYLTHKAEQLGYQPQLILSGRRLNDEMPRHAGRSIIKRMLKNGIDVASSRIAVLGVTFKDNCPDIRNSKVVDLVDELESWGATVSLIDPWANPNEVMSTYGLKLEGMEACCNVDAIVIAVAHKEFKSLDLVELRAKVRKDSPVFGDLKSVFPADRIRSLGFTVFRL